MFLVEEGETKDCQHCPFGDLHNGDYGEEYFCENGLDNILDCKKFDLTTLKIFNENEKEIHI